MIIHSLELTNYRVFSGKHDIQLAPSSKKKNITLFGGLNGAGKTSILSAVKFALHGEKAFGQFLTRIEYYQGRPYL